MLGYVVGVARIKNRHVSSFLCTKIKRFVVADSNFYAKTGFSSNSTSCCFRKMTVGISQISGNVS